MFLPKSEASVANSETAERARREGYSRIENWVTAAICDSLCKSTHLLDASSCLLGVTVSVQEVVCGDPECSPIDTSVAILFPSGGRGMLGIPAESKDVTKQALLDDFPATEVLGAWSRGEEADWPPLDDSDEQDMRPSLRFDVGRRVVCRVGADPVTGWAQGVVVQLWYREPSWPVNSWAPYKIELEDGRNIFAPGDVDKIIREA